MQTSLNCLFCKIVKREGESFIIAENKEVIAILDKFSESDGHTLLITKKHFPYIAEVDEESWKYLLPLVKEVIKKLKVNLQPGGFNIISNMNEDIEKKIAYQSIPHLHIHIIPKYKKDEGFIWTTKPRLSYSLKQIAEKLKCHELHK